MPSFRDVRSRAWDVTTTATFKAFYDELKPRGILAIVEHGANDGTALKIVKLSTARRYI